MSIRVNGKEIDQGLVDQIFMERKAAAELELEISCCERNDEFLQAAIDDAINQNLLIEEAESRLPKIPFEELRERLEAITKIYRDNGASWEMLETQKEVFREEAKADIRMSSYLESLFSDLTEPTEEELKSYYEEKENIYVKPARARCLHICKFPENGDSPLAQYESLCDIRKEAIAGSYFETLAYEHTEREDKKVDFGWTPLEQVKSNFEAILFSLKLDEVSPVFYEEEAFHLVKVTGVEEGSMTPFDEVKGDLVGLYIQDQKRKTLRIEAERLRKDAVIEGLEDSQLVART